MKRRSNIIAIIGFSIGAYFFIIKPFIINRYLLYTDNDIATGKIVGKESAVEGSADYVVNYQVNNKQYSCLLGQDIRYKLNIGDCVLIKYYPPNPNIAHIDESLKVDCNN